MIRNHSIEERICESFYGNSFSSIQSSIKKIHSLGEWRFDLSGLMVDDISKVKECTNKSLIFTCRKSQIDETDRLKAYSIALQAHYEYIDLDLNEDIKILKELEKEIHNSSTQLILSYHNYTETPHINDLKHWIQKAKSSNADLIKVACATVNEKEDLQVLSELQNTNKNTICFAMGQAATKSRINSLLNDGKFTYAALKIDKTTALGQADYATLARLYQQTLMAKEIRLAVIGKPIAHSKSPAIFKELFEQNNINGSYEKLELSSIEDFEKIKEDYIGFNVTAPYKQSIIKHLNSLSQEAQSIGAVNTIYKKGDQWIGENTDFLGIIQSLKNSVNNFNWKQISFLILGAGGASRAAIYAAKSLGNRIYICNRTYSKAQNLAQEFQTHSIKKEDLNLQDFTVIINTIPEPFSLINVQQLNKQHIILDAIYPHSKFSPYHIEQGFQLIPGEYWLWNQAMAAFSIFQSNNQLLNPYSNQ